MSVPGEGPTLVFRVGARCYGIPLAAVSEVTGGGAPRLIPLVPSEVGGVLNVRGEPLVVLDAGTLFEGRPCGARRHVIALSRRELRLGVLVEGVSGIETGIDGTPLPEEEVPPAGPLSVRWVIGADERVGIVDPEQAFERAAELLATRPLWREEGAQACPTES